MVIVGDTNQHRLVRIARLASIKHPRLPDSIIINRTWLPFERTEFEIIACPPRSAPSLSVSLLPRRRPGSFPFFPGLRVAEAHNPFDVTHFPANYQLINRLISHGPLLIVSLFDSAELFYLRRLNICPLFVILNSPSYR